MMVTDSAISNREFLRALLVALVALGISAVLLVGGYLFTFPLIHPEFLPKTGNATPYSLNGSDFTPVVFAGGRHDGESSVVTALAEGMPDDQAILMRKIRLHAGDYAFLRYDLDGRQPGLRVMLFWKTVAGGEQPFYSELDNPGNGQQYHNLRRSEEWRGEITELAIGFFGDLRGETVKLRGVRLEPYSAGGLLGVVWDEWTAQSTWSQSSINRLRAIPEDGILSPVITVGLSYLLTALLLTTVYGVTRHKAGALLAITISGLICWIALDISWQRSLDWQLRETRYLFSNKDVHERKLADVDGELYATIYDIKENVLPTPGPVIWVLADETNDYYGSRAKYHLTPHQVRYDGPERRMFRRMQRFGFAKAGDYVLAIKNNERLTFSVEKGQLKFYNRCAPAAPLFENTVTTLYLLQGDLNRCAP